MSSQESSIADMASEGSVDEFLNSLNEELLDAELPITKTAKKETFMEVSPYVLFSFLVLIQLCHYNFVFRKINRNLNATTKPY